MGISEAIVACIVIGIIVVSAIFYKSSADKKREKQTLLHELWTFLGCNPNELSIVERQFSSVDLPNLQLAIEGYADRCKAVRRVVGYSSESSSFENNLRSLIRESYNSTSLGPVVYSERDNDIRFSKARCINC